MIKELSIDIFEFQILIEACWHGGTILRASVMKKAIDTWFDNFSKEERKKIYDFFNRTKNDESDRRGELQQRFLARYNPNNQWLVETEFEGKKDSVETYQFNDKFYLTTTQWVDEKYIYDFNKIGA